MCYDPEYEEGKRQREIARAAEAAKANAMREIDLANSRRMDEFERSTNLVKATVEATENLGRVNRQGLKELSFILDRIRDRQERDRNEFVTLKRQVADLAVQVKHQGDAIAMYQPALSRRVKENA